MSAKAIGKNEKHTITTTVSLAKSTKSEATKVIMDRKATLRALVTVNSRVKCKSRINNFEVFEKNSKYQLILETVVAHQFGNRAVNKSVEIVMDNARARTLAFTALSGVANSTKKIKMSNNNRCGIIRLQKVSSTNTHMAFKGASGAQGFSQSNTIIFQQVLILLQLPGKWYGGDLDGASCGGTVRHILRLLP